MAGIATLAAASGANLRHGKKRKKQAEKETGVFKDSETLTGIKPPTGRRSASQRRAPTPGSPLPARRTIKLGGVRSPLSAGG